jgi:hypothetical protein
VTDALCFVLGSVSCLGALAAFVRSLPPRAVKVEPAPTACTGVSAMWCPRCGDCRCPVNEAGETVSVEDLGYYGKDSPDCPLHARGSRHAEPA